MCWLWVGFKYSLDKLKQIKYMKLVCHCVEYLISCCSHLLASALNIVLMPVNLLWNKMIMSSWKGQPVPGRNINLFVFVIISFLFIILSNTWTENWVVSYVNNRIKNHKDNNSNRSVVLSCHADIIIIFVCFIIVL